MSGPEYKTFDLDQVGVMFLGIPLDGGYGEGGAIKVEKVDSNFTYKKGQDGSITRSKTGSRVTKVTLCYMQSAANNSVLSVIANIDQAKHNGAGVGPFLLKDGGGTTLMAGTMAWIDKDPDAEFKAEVTDREWVLIVADMARFDGSN